MAWVIRVEKQDGVWGVSRHEADKENWKPLTSTSLSLAGKRKANSITTNFSDWTLATPTQVASITNNQIDLVVGHQSFLFQQDGITYLVPSFVLIQGTFRPLKHIAPWLLRLCGLEQLVTPATGDRPCENLLTINGSGQLQQKPALRTLLGWIWNYPSARAMWNSVYKNISQGRIGIELPQGTGRFKVAGELKNGVFVVSSLTLTRLTTSEPQFMSSNSPKLVLELHGAHAPKATLEEYETVLIQRFSSRPCRLTDEEWSGLRNLIPRLHHFELDVRQVIEGIINKLTNKTPWRKSTYAEGTYLNACQAYRRWKRNGTWKKICLFLCADPEASQLERISPK